mmetsp:Transcript_29116/g.59540  ORF Transcript_29116/g.59540 Transcript_29116/m.59540 type:complete len:125 (-) Transcript_29116:556-930(-)
MHPGIPDFPRNLSKATPRMQMAQLALTIWNARVAQWIPHMIEIRPVYHNPHGCWLVCVPHKKLPRAGCPREQLQYVPPWRHPDGMCHLRAMQSHPGIDCGMHDDLVVGIPVEVQIHFNANDLVG